MSESNVPALQALFGSAVVDLPIMKDTRWYLVDPVNGLDTNTGLYPEAAMLTLAAAEDKTVANRHDAVIYIAGSSSLSLGAELVWDKNYTHLVGLCAPTMVGQRARIFATAGNLDLTPLITVSATGCIVKNLYIFHGVDDADALVNVQVSGQRNYFENVHFAGAGHTSNAIDGAASLNLNGSAAENTFVNCTIGVDTVVAATGVTCLLLDGGTATLHTTRNIFKGCNFVLKAGAAGCSFIELMQITAIDRYTIFDNCLFINLSATAMTEAIVCPAGLDTNDKRLIFKDCALIGAPGWDISNRNVAVGNMGTPTGVDLSGVMLTLEG
jgi:hypothetical protein